MNNRILQEMYQQWIQGQSDVAQRWLDFVEMAARVHRTTPDHIMKELQKCRWFLKGD